MSLKFANRRRQETDRLRILILNWRCPRNPKAGGAEFITFEIARRLVCQGHAVEWFSAKYPQAPAEEVIDGIRIVRAGRQWTVHLAAIGRYRKRLAQDFDVVVDQVNTIPFFTPIWGDIPSVMFIHQLAREVWWFESPFPLSLLGYVLEPIYLRMYRRIPALTVSNSTLQDLKRLGFRGPITVIPEGVSPVTDVSRPQSLDPAFLYVGRLAPSKRLEDMLRAFALFRSGTAQGMLWLVGDGSAQYRAKLVALAQRLGVQESVTFWGRLSDRDKYHLMTSATALLMTSVREGWGLVVTEANACGTPAIVYDVPGLRDAVQNEITGLIVKEDPASLSGAMLRIASDPGLRNRLATAAQQWSEDFSLDTAAESFGAQLRTATAQ